MQTVKLNNGIDMPILGLGVYQISDYKECVQSVSNALEIGYRSIDTAAAYQNEAAVGEAITQTCISRNDLFITTKLWVSDTGYERTLKAFERSLNKLKTDYLDLYLIHQPYGDIYGSWRAMQELYKAGKVKAIGISNFPADRVMDLTIHNEVPPAINQIEVHPFHQQIETQAFLKENNVQIEAWGQFAEGRNNIFSNSLLESIGKKYGKSVAQVTLRWLIQRAVVVIPKSVRKEKLIENFNVFDFELSIEDMKAIETLDTRQSLFFDHRDPVMVKSLGSYILPE
jgi:Aldo/keto reductases, related to diketogulonate reductase